VTGPHLGDALSALLDGELSGDEAAAARAHLGECRSCADELAGVESVRGVVRGLTPVDPPAVVSLSRRGSPLTPVAAAAAALVLLAAWTPVGGPVRPQVAALAATGASAGASSLPSVLDSAAQPVSTPEPPAPTGAKVMAKLAAPFSAPAVLGGEYQREAVYAWGQVVDAVYSDGMHTMSVFAQAGRLSAVHLPAGADQWMLGPAHRHARHYRWPGGDMVVWQAGGVVYTVVGDAPADDMRAAAGSIPGGRRLSATVRLRRTARSMAETLLGR
jgi:anti-sigma factor RsiW